MSGTQVLGDQQRGPIASGSAEIQGPKGDKKDKWDRRDKDDTVIVDHQKMQVEQIPKLLLTRQTPQLMGWR